MRKFVIVVPTANRYETIDYWLQETAQESKEHDVDLIIYDSSDDELTKEITYTYINKGYKNVHYHRYDGYFDGISLDHKLISIYQDYAEQYEYIWIIRDGLIPRIHAFYKKLCSLIDKKYECMIIDSMYRNNYVPVEIIYDTCMHDYSKLLYEQAHRMQTLGMLIFSSEFAMKLINEIPIDKKSYSLWQMAAPLHYYGKHEMRIIFCVGDSFTYNPNCFKGHFWQAGEKLFQQWGIRWCNVIDGLPELYDDAKQKVYMIYTCDFHPFKPTTIAELKANNCLKLKTVRKYKRELKLVTNTPLWFIYFVSCTPRYIWKYVVDNEKSLFSVLIWAFYMFINNIEPMEGRIEL